MKKKLHFLYLLPLLLLSLAGAAQTKISGRVLDSKDKPIKGVSVALNNTLDGGTTDSAGYFMFETTETGSQSLVATDATHATMGLPLTIVSGDITGLVLRMRTSVLDGVTITAGSFASGGRTVTVMSPLDVMTTAGSNGDVVKAMQMMPGTQQSTTENGLFIRGGDANEAAMIVDGLVVQTAFASGPPGIATRSRFSPFQFQGISFSSGGYSSRFGQALSGVLDLTSTDISDKSTLNFGIYMAGLYASGTKRWKNASLDIGGSYTNLAPLYALASTNYKIYKMPQGGSTNLRYVWQPNKNSIFKATVSGSYNTSGLTVPNASGGVSDTNNPASYQPDTINFLTRDTYIYGNMSYKQTYKNKYQLYAAASYSFDRNSNSIGTYPIDKDEYRGQFRIEGKDFISSRVSLLVGTDVQHYGIRQDMGQGFRNDSFARHLVFDETQAAAYAEMEWTPIYWLAIRPGVRYEHSVMLNTDKVAPRFSAAIKTSTNSQISLAGGIFYQTANNNYYLAGLRPGMQNAIHYIANWQLSKHDRTFRIEGYYKNYQDLVYEPNNTNPFNPSRYRTFNSSMLVNNNGHGYAQGLELFWKDKKSIKNADYWISYSYIDTKRLWENYPTMATPTFIANHTLSIVGKYFVDKWHTNISGTYSFASGFPYYNPETAGDKNAFLNDKSPVFNNVAVTIAYLHTFGKFFSVFYASIDNVLNTHNVSGYRYSYDNNNNVIKGSKTPIVPGFYRTVFVGANFSLTKFSKDEL